MSESNANYVHVMDPSSCAHCAGGSNNTITTKSIDGDGIVYVDIMEQVPPHHDVNVIVKSLSTQPVIQFKNLTESTDSNNVWIVDAYEYMPDTCSTSKIVYKGDTFFMNVCECDGKATVDLVLEINGDIKRTSFMLEKSCNANDMYDMILSV